MGQTMLQNVQDVCLEYGLTSPSAVAGSSDDTYLQLLALMNRVGNQLATEFDWQFLSKEHRFQTVYYQYTGDTTNGSTTLSNVSSIVGLSSDFMVTGNGIQQDTFVVSASGTDVVMNVPATATATGVTFTFGQALYSMPADYDRIVNKTQYNKSNRWSVIGPKDPQEWQWLKASYVTTGPRMRFRIVGDKFAIWPMPSSTLTLGFEYISKNWAADSGGTGIAKFTADTDTCLYPDQLMILGTKMKFAEIKGFDTTALFADFSRELSKFKAQNAGADTLSMQAKYPDILLTQNNIPDTGYGNTTT